MPEILQKLEKIKLQMREWGSIYRFVLLCVFASVISVFLPALYTLPLVLLFGAFYECIAYIGKRTGRDRLFAGAAAPTALLLAFILRHSEARSDVLYAVILWYAVFFLLANRWLLKIVLAITVFLCLYRLRAAQVTKPVAVLTLLAVMTELADLFRHFSYEKPEADHAAGALAGQAAADNSVRIWMPFFAVLSLLLLIMPVSVEPFDWSFVRELSADLREQAGNLAADLEYYLSRIGLNNGYVSGYNGLGNHSGTLAVSDREELYVSEKIPHRLYLDGVSYTTLSPDGTWSGRSTFTEADEGWLALYLNALMREGITSEEAQCFSLMYERSIVYGQIRSSDLMHPLHTVLLGDRAMRDLVPGGGFALKRSKKRGYVYDFVMMDMDAANPYLRRVLRNAAQNAAADENEHGFAPYSDAAAYMQEVYRKPFNRYFSLTEYMNVMQGLEHPDMTEYLETGAATERMRDLALRITDGLDNDFDRCAAIEAYLRKYHYSTMPGPVPEGANWLDHFLFESGEGYCVHFAGAMVELCRLAGIPARYTEGYVCRFHTDTPKGYAVRGSEAHAWPEVWIDGFGFIRFEPTPGMQTASDMAWGKLTAADRGESVGTGSVTHSEPEPWTIPEPEVVFAGYEEPEPVEEPGEKLLESFRRWGIILLLLAGVLAAYLILMLAVRRLWLDIRYRRADLKERMRMEQTDVRFFIRALTGAGPENLSLLQSADRLAAYPGAGGLAERIRESVYTWYAYCYGGHKPAAGEDERDARMRRDLYLFYLDSAEGSLPKRTALKIRALWQLFSINRRRTVLK